MPPIAQPARSSLHRRLRIPAAIVALAGAGSFLPSAPAAAQVVCGDTIGPNEDVVLTRDVVCDDGRAFILTVVGPATLDLNGHAVVCDDADGDAKVPDAAIALDGARAVVRGGVVRGCLDGIRLSGSGRHAVTAVTALSNRRDGFLVVSDANRIEDSSALLNDAGFVVLGKVNRLTRNTATRNAIFGYEVHQRGTLEDNVANGSGDGFFVRGKGSVLTGNQAIGNEHGFTVRGEANRLVDNRVESNDRGFDLQQQAKRNTLTGNVVEDSLFEGMVVRGVGNKLVRNDVSGSGGYGIRLPNGTTKSVLTKNRAFGNADTDLRDDSPACGTNRWRDNASTDRNQDCID